MLEETAEELEVAGLVLLKVLAEMPVEAPCQHSPTMGGNRSDDGGQALEHPLLTWVGVGGHVHVDDGEVHPGERALEDHYICSWPPPEMPTLQRHRRGPTQR